MSTPTIIFLLFIALALGSWLTVKGTQFLLDSIMHEEESETIESVLYKIEEFQFRFGQPINEYPVLLPAKDALLRFKLMVEENEEYLEAVQNNDMVEVADALGDMLYILGGTIVNHGMQHIIERVFNEIHASNMSKLGEDGKPIFREDGKVMKGPNFFQPNLKQFL